MRYTKYWLLLLPILFGCGTTTGDRAAGGAGIGAGNDAVIAGDPLNGALIGQSGGSVEGRATSSNNVDLGEPVWK